LFREKKGTYNQNPAERKQARMPEIDKVVVITGASSVELRTRETIK
jgi:hypothetical protein